MGVRHAPRAQVGGLGLLREVTGAGSEGRALRERGERRQSPLGPAPAPRSGLSQQPSQHSSAASCSSSQGLLRQTALV